MADEKKKAGAGILGFIGGTPLVKMAAVSPAGGGEVWGKPEFFNPGGSVKDRIALSMVEDAERRRLLVPGGTVVEPTSGNTGIGLAMVCAARGYRCVLAVPETVSRERIYLLKLFGAEVVFTPGDKGMRGAVEKAEELLGKMPGSYMPQQFRNPANPAAHRETTALEILGQTGGRLDAFVAGVGTGGTITGVGEVLKEHDRGIRVIAVEPRSSAVLSGGSPGRHGIQGIGAGFVPEVLNRSVIDEITTVGDDEAWETSALVARAEGIQCGISSGAAVFAALKEAGRQGRGGRVVVILPDAAERYCSAGLHPFSGGKPAGKKNGARGGN